VLRSAQQGARLGHGAVLALVLVVASLVASPATAEPPDGRAYEMVSPPGKNGADVISDSQRTRAAVDGSAVGFTSLAAFAGNQGTGISSDYVAVREIDPDPGNNGWTTHGIMPAMRSLSVNALFAQVDPLYEGNFSPDLRKGVLISWGALDGDPNLDGVANLYRNNDLRSTSATFDLVSACPFCADSSTPLPDYPATSLAISLRPTLADSSPDVNHIVFESLERLTNDAPTQPGACDLTASAPFLACHSRAYEWDNGSVSLAGRVPVLPAIECDDDGSPNCVPADVSIPGQGTGVSRGSLSNNTRTQHVVSDGSDGHSRVFFTQPTNAAGQTSDELGNSVAVNRSATGRLFMRLDARQTVQIDASERTPAAPFAPSQFLDASVDGKQAYFMSTAPLTNDAPDDGFKKLYAYDTTKPADAPDNLALISQGVGDDVSGVIGAGRDGNYVYFVVGTGTRSIYVWHAGTVRLIGPGPGGNAQLAELVTAGTANWVLRTYQARVTPDGRHLLFAAFDGTGLLGYDHGSCVSDLGVGCRELYVYSADDGALACASCNPSGAPATAMGMSGVWDGAGASHTSWHWNRAITDDGAHVFFSSGEKLVPEDANSRVDAYEYDVASRQVHLISTGKDPSDSFFLDASADGHDVFFATREQLVGWDVDSAYDLYDARVGGGFPDPTPTPNCSSDACQGNLSVAPSSGALATSLFRGAGNLHEKGRPHRTKRCKRGYLKKRVRGKVKCVKRHRKRHHATARVKRAQRDERRGS